MRKIEISDYEDTWSFSIERVKIVQGENKYRFFKALQHQLLKEDASEYESEQNQRNEMKINGQKYDTKTNKIFVLNPLSNFDEELKLTAKSLLVEYLDSQLKDVDYQDEFIMLNQSIEVINQELYDELSVESFETKLSFCLPSFTLKTLIKNTVAEIDRKSVV